MSPAPLPDSGDGLAPPAPDALPHPALWSDPPPATAPAAFRRREDEDDLPPRTRGRLLAVYAAVAAMILAAALLGLALVRTSWPLAAVGVVLGLAGLGTALRERVMSLVTVGQSPEGA